MYTGEVNALVVLELGDGVEGEVDIVQVESLELLLPLPGEVVVVAEHLPHFVDRDGGVDGAGQPTPPNQRGEAPQVQEVRVAQQHRVNLLQVPVNQHLFTNYN